MKKSKNYEFLRENQETKLNFTFNNYIRLKQFELSRAILHQIKPRSEQFRILETKLLDSNEDIYVKNFCLTELTDIKTREKYYLCLFEYELLLRKAFNLGYLTRQEVKELDELFIMKLKEEKIEKIIIYSRLFPDDEDDLASSESLTPGEYIAPEIAIDGQYQIGIFRKLIGKDLELGSYVCELLIQVSSEMRTSLYEMYLDYALSDVRSPELMVDVVNALHFEHQSEVSTPILVKLEECLKRISQQTPKKPAFVSRFINKRYHDLTLHLMKKEKLYLQFKIVKKQHFLSFVVERIMSTIDERNLSEIENLFLNHQEYWRIKNLILMISFDKLRHRVKDLEYMDKLFDLLLVENDQKLYSHCLKLKFYLDFSRWLASKILQFGNNQKNIPLSFRKVSTFSLENIRMIVFDKCYQESSIPYIVLPFLNLFMQSELYENMAGRETDRIIIKVFFIINNFLKNQMFVMGKGEFRKYPRFQLALFENIYSLIFIKTKQYRFLFDSHPLLIKKVLQTIRSELKHEKKVNEEYDDDEEEEEDDDEEIVQEEEEEEEEGEGEGNGEDEQPKKKKIVRKKKKKKKKKKKLSREERRMEIRKTQFLEQVDRTAFKLDLVLRFHMTNGIVAMLCSPPITYVTKALRLNRFDLAKRVDKEFGLGQSSLIQKEEDFHTRKKKDVEDGDFMYFFDLFMCSDEKELRQKHQKKRFEELEELDDNDEEERKLRDEEDEEEKEEIEEEEDMMMKKKKEEEEEKEKETTTTSEKKIEEGEEEEEKTSTEIPSKTPLSPTLEEIEMNPDLLLDYECLNSLKDQFGVEREGDMKMFLDRVKRKNFLIEIQNPRAIRDLKTDFSFLGQLVPFSVDFDFEKLRIFIKFPESDPKTPTTYSPSNNNNLLSSPSTTSISTGGSSTGGGGGERGNVEDIKKMEFEFLSKAETNFLLKRFIRHLYKNSQLMMESYGVSYESMISTSSSSGIESISGSSKSTTMDDDDDDEGLIIIDHDLEEDNVFIGHGEEEEEERRRKQQHGGGERKLFENKNILSTGIKKMICQLVFEEKKFEMAKQLAHINGLNLLKILWKQLISEDEQQKALKQQQEQQKQTTTTTKTDSSESSSSSPPRKRDDEKKKSTMRSITKKKKKNKKRKKKSGIGGGSEEKYNIEFLNLQVLEFVSQQNLLIAILMYVLLKKENDEQIADYLLNRSKEFPILHTWLSRWFEEDDENNQSSSSSKSSSSSHHTSSNSSPTSSSSPTMMLINNELSFHKEKIIRKCIEQFKVRGEYLRALELCNKIQDDELSDRLIEKLVKLNASKYLPQLVYRIKDKKLMIQLIFDHVEDLDHINSVIEVFQIAKENSEPGTNDEYQSGIKLKQFLLYKEILAHLKFKSWKELHRKIHHSLAELIRQLNKINRYELSRRLLKFFDHSNELFIDIEKDFLLSKLLHPRMNYTKLLHILVTYKPSDGLEICESMLENQELDFEKKIFICNFVITALRRELSSDQIKIFESILMGLKIFQQLQNKNLEERFKHLIFYPALIIENLVMLREIAYVSKILKVVDIKKIMKDSDAMFLMYGVKALDLNSNRNRNRITSFSFVPRSPTKNRIRRRRRELMGEDDDEEEEDGDDNDNIKSRTTNPTKRKSRRERSVIRRGKKKVKKKNNKKKKKKKMMKKNSGKKKSSSGGGARKLNILTGSGVTYGGGEASTISTGSHESAEFVLGGGTIIQGEESKENSEEEDSNDDDDSFEEEDFEEEDDDDDDIQDKESDSDISDLDDNDNERKNKKNQQEKTKKSTTTTTKRRRRIRKGGKSIGGGGSLESRRRKRKNMKTKYNIYYPSPDESSSFTFSTYFKGNPEEDQEIREQFFYINTPDLILAKSLFDLVAKPKSVGVRILRFLEFMEFNYREPIPSSADGSGGSGGGGGGSTTTPLKKSSTTPGSGSGSGSGSAVGTFQIHSIGFSIHTQNFRTLSVEIQHRNLERLELAEKLLQYSKFCFLKDPEGHQEFGYLHSVRQRMKLLKLLVYANACTHMQLTLHLLTDKNKLRQIRDHLIKNDFLRLALKICRISGVETTPVLMEWGLLLLRLESYKMARVRFEECSRGRDRHSVKRMLEEILRILQEKAYLFEKSQSSSSIIPSSDNRKQQQQSKKMEEEEEEEEEIQEGRRRRRSRIRSSSKTRRKSQTTTTTTSKRYISKRGGGGRKKKKTENTRQKIMDEAGYYLKMYGKGEDYLRFFLDMNEIDTVLDYCFSSSSSSSTSKSTTTTDHHHRIHHHKKDRSRRRRYGEKEDEEDEDDDDNNNNDTSTSSSTTTSMMVSMNEFKQLVLPYLYDYGLLKHFKNRVKSIDRGVKKYHSYLHAICKFLHRISSFHLLYDFQLFMKDEMRCGYTCIQIFIQEHKKLYDSSVNIMKRISSGDSMDDSSSSSSSSSSFNESGWKNCKLLLARGKQHFIKAINSKKLRSEQRNAEYVSSCIMTINFQMELLKLDLIRVTTQSDPNNNIISKTLFTSNKDRIAIVEDLVMFSKNRKLNSLALKIMSEYNLKAARIFRNVMKRMVVSNYSVKEINLVLDPILRGGGLMTLKEHEKDDLVLQLIMFIVEFHKTEKSKYSKLAERFIVKIRSYSKRIRAYMECGRYKYAYKMATERTNSSGGERLGGGEKNNAVEKNLVKLMRKDVNMIYNFLQKIDSKMSNNVKDHCVKWLALNKGKEHQFRDYK